jgi:hypothetical protein
MYMFPSVHSFLLLVVIARLVTLKIIPAKGILREFIILSILMIIIAIELIIVSIMFGINWKI